MAQVGRSGRYRVYNDTHVLLIRLILQAKAQGFKLAEIKRAISYQNEKEPWFHVLKLIEQKQQSLSEEISRKLEQRDTLSKIYSEIETCLSVNPECQLEDTA